MLDRQWQAHRQPRGRDASLPFRGGWALLLGYELAAQVEPVLALPAPAGGLPVACALRCPAAVLRDRGSGECIAVAEAGEEAWLKRIVADVARAAALPALPEWQPPAVVDEDPPQRYVDGVAAGCTSSQTPSACRHGIRSIPPRWPICSRSANGRHSACVKGYPRGGMANWCICR